LNNRVNTRSRKCRWTSNAASSRQWSNVKI
jgi:hypothetical protein